MSAIRRRPLRRVHFVLVPGFAGFDALGQLEYYAGITPLFRSWQRLTRHNETVLHYFDNFPTAAVATRALRLRRYLTKRIARGEFSANDSIALIGHSTGGLDIRRLLYDLSQDLAIFPKKAYTVDGGKGAGFPVLAEKLFRMIDRIVFLSVPQWGTNIADWVRAHEPGPAVIIAELRTSVAASQLPLLGRVEECVSTFAAKVSNFDVLCAINDALCEAEATSVGDPMQAALAQEAACHLELWLRHMATDFAVIDDLTAELPTGPAVSPAHFTREQREDEKSSWKDHDIKAQSYATVGKCPFRFDGSGTIPRWELSRPGTYPECTARNLSSKNTDIVYRTCYRACAGGPFTYPKDPTFVPVATVFGSSEKRRIEVWENDGIVNTASMLWPNAVETQLVEGDHMDIVGHYRRVPATSPQEGRQYEAYDLMQSGSRFHAVFDRVWASIFEFCVS